MKPKAKKIILIALGERDCAIGKRPMLKNAHYLAGYGRQYAKEQRSIVIYENVF